MNIGTFFIVREFRREDLSQPVQTIVDRIEHAAKGDGTITFTTGDLPLTYSWAELHESAKLTAARLQARGIQKGDHVALLGPTTPELVTCFQAVWLCGATLVVLPLPMRLASIEDFTLATKSRIRRADCAAVLIDPDLAAFVAVSDDDPPLYGLDELVGDINDGVSIDSYIRPDVHADDLFVLQFTSGSTSEPKGVMLPNRVVAANLDAIHTAAQVEEGRDVMVSWLPLYHDMGLVGFCILPMSSGIDLVLGAPQDFLAKPARWMEWISTYGGTATAGPNFSWVLATRALNRSKKKLDLSSLRIALNGAEPVDPVGVRAFVEAARKHGMSPDAIFPAFGMAETAIAGSFPAPGSGLQTDIVDSEILETEHRAVSVPPDHPNAREIAKLGAPVPGLAFRIIDPQTNEEIAERMVGELQISGTSLTSGYYKHPEATDESFDGDWLKTGDLAYITDGQMVMCGRIKDLIIVGGRNVYPQDIERSVAELEEIRSGNVIAFAVEGRKGKEAVGVVAETRHEPTHELIAAIERQVLSAVGVPAREIILVKPNTLPKTSSGKLQRVLCRQKYLDGELQRA